MEYSSHNKGKSSSGNGNQSFLLAGLNWTRNSFRLHTKLAQGEEDAINHSAAMSVMLVHGAQIQQLLVEWSRKWHSNSISCSPKKEHHFLTRFGNNNETCSRERRLSGPNKLLFSRNFEFPEEYSNAVVQWPHYNSKKSGVSPCRNCVNSDMELKICRMMPNCTNCSGS